MFKGFMAGSLVLIVIYVVSQPGASRKSVEASNAFTASLRRLFSPQVAGIGDHSKTATTGAAKGGARSDRTAASAALAEQPNGTLFTT